MVLDFQGRPICCELWPGNTPDAKSLVPVVRRMQRRLGVRKVTKVADRGTNPSGATYSTAFGR